MDESKAIKAVTQSFVDKWKYLLSIEDWDILFRYSKLDEDELGACMVEPHHKSAVIILDITKIKDKQELLETLRHELIHITHAHFNSYRQAVSKNLAPNVSEIADDIFSIGAEDLVLKVEHLLHKLDIDIQGK